MPALLIASLCWRMALCTFVFTSVGISLTAIRNKINPLDQAVAGSAMGIVWKFKVSEKKIL